MQFFQIGPWMDDEVQEVSPSVNLQTSTNRIVQLTLLRILPKPNRETELNYVQLAN